jgi:hypothetical protein
MGTNNPPSKSRDNIREKLVRIGGLLCNEAMDIKER